VSERHSRTGPGETAYARAPEGPLFPRTSIVTTTALALAEAHVAAGETEPCGQCGEPSPCPTAVHAREVVRLSMPGLRVPTMLGLFDDEP